MNSNWKFFSVEEIADNQKSSIAIGPFGSRMKSDCYVEKGIPVIRGNNITDGKYPEGDFVFIDDKKASEVISSHVFGGDLVFPHRGAIGRVALVKESTHMIISSSLMKLTPNKERCSSEFLLYFFRSKKGRYELLKNASTVGTPGIGQPLSSLKSIVIPLPPLPEQKAIAHILGTLDKKIELNHQKNETFEDITNTLFKSWFVDFDPVRAKTEGHSTKLPDEISNLFPDSFANSNLGQIPKGWEVVQLADLVKNISRGISPKYSDKEEYPVINQKCIRNTQINFSLCKFTEYKKNMESKFLSKFDVLVNSMGVGTLGRVSMFINHNKNILVDGCVTSIRGKTQDYSIFIFQNLSLREKEIINLSTGSTGQTSLSKESLLNMDFIKPGEKIIETFSYLMKDFYIQRSNNIIENNYLTSLRNILLPKLISGELKIPDAEKIIEGI